jgi:hypothetical protein
MLNFAAGMKNLSIRFLAALLVVWYSMSIIGFGVHTCLENNRSFLTSFVNGSTCEDVHPTKACGFSCCSKVEQKSEHKCCCAHHTIEHETTADGQKYEQTNCCTNDYQQLDITGSGQDRGLELNVISLYSHVCCHIYLIADILTSHSANHSLRTLQDRCSHVGELRPFLSVWRI